MESTAILIKKREKWKKYLFIYMMVLPGTVYLFIDKIIPMFGIIIAFKKMDFQRGIIGSPWYGLHNFKFLFQSNDAWLITRNTILYNVAFFVVGTVLSVTLAILINSLKSKKAAKVYQTLVLLPFLVSWVVISYLTYAFLSVDNGLINTTLLKMLGMNPINWYQAPQYWPFILISVNTWKTIGYSMIIYLSSIVGINQDYYDAANIDGAGPLRRVFLITLPLLTPTFLTIMIISVGQIFRSDFGLFYQVPKNSGALYGVTRTIDVYVYQALMKNSNYAMSGAAGFYQAIVGLILILSANSIIRRIEPKSVLF